MRLFLYLERIQNIIIYTIFFLFCLVLFLFSFFLPGTRLSDIILVTKCASSHIEGGLQAPIFFQEPLPRLLFSNDTGSHISCSAHGNPPPVVTWVSKDGSLVAPVPGLRYVYCYVVMLTIYNL